MDVDLDERSWSLGLLQVQCKGKWVHHGENEVLDIWGITPPFLNLKHSAVFNG